MGHEKLNSQKQRENGSYQKHRCRQQEDAGQLKFHAGRVSSGELRMAALITTAGLNTKSLLREQVFCLLVFCTGLGIKPRARQVLYLWATSSVLEEATLDISLHTQYCMR